MSTVMGKTQAACDHIPAEPCWAREKESTAAPGTGRSKVGLARGSARASDRGAHGRGVGLQDCVSFEQACGARNVVVALCRRIFARGQGGVYSRSGDVISSAAAGKRGQ